MPFGRRLTYWIVTLCKVGILFNGIDLIIKNTTIVVRIPFIIKRFQVLYFNFETINSFLYKVLK